MDIVIPLIENTGNNHAELRFALRSFEMYLPHDRVYLIGYKPDWCNDNIDWLPFRDDQQPKFREANIYLKVRYFIDKLQLKDHDDFIFCNDDYFLLRAWDGNPPYPNKGTLYDTVKSRVSFDPYRRTISNTIRILGGEALNLDVHAPMVMNVGLFKRVFGKSKQDVSVEEYKAHPIQWSTPYGFLFKSLYGQHHESYESEDIKFNTMEELANGIIAPSNVSFFSTNDMAVAPLTESFFTALYPEPSHYEK